MYRSRLYRKTVVTWVFRRKAIAFQEQLFRRGILRRFRHPIWLSFIQRNFFFQTPVSRQETKSVLSTGHLPDFARSTKKKKTFIAGSTGLYTLLRDARLADLRIMSYTVTLRGKLAAKKGVFFALRQLRTRLFLYRDRSSVVHNGTRGVHVRRL